MDQPEKLIRQLDADLVRSLHQDFVEQGRGSVNDLRDVLDELGHGDVLQHDGGEGAVPGGGQEQAQPRTDGLEMKVIVEPHPVHHPDHLNELVLAEPQHVPRVVVAEGLDELAVPVVRQPARGRLRGRVMREGDLPCLAVSRVRTCGQQRSIGH